MMDNSFLFSNMAPQYGNFNRKIWERLEETVNKWAKDVGVFIVTGAVFDRNLDGRRDADSGAERMKRVGVPSHFYKIILHIRQDGRTIDSISFLLTHDDHNHPNKETYLNTTIVNIDKIERLTGIDFFPTMPSDRQRRIEAGRAISLKRWFTD